MEDVDTFYGAFKDNISVYELENSLVVEIIFGLIDFAKFKASILRYKEDNKSNLPGASDEGN